MSALPPIRLDVYARNEALARLSEGAVGSPFQSSGWIGGWIAAHGMEEAFRLVEITLADGRWHLPLAVNRRAGVEFAQKIGGAHASFFTPLRIGAPRALTPADLKAVARALGVDALVLTDCPTTWAGYAPFSPAFVPSPDIARGCALSGGAQTAPYAGEAGKKLRAKARKLAALGPLDARFLTGQSAQDALQALLAWKAAQFRAMGVNNPFEDPGIPHFLAQGLAAGDALRIFALRFGEKPLAAMVIAQSGGHASGMMTAYDPEGEANRFGPGDVLVMHLVEALSNEGVTGFDLGVGDARYKRLHAPDAIELVDAYGAASLKGAALVATCSAARAAKARIKRHGGLFDSLKAARARLLGG